MGNKVLVKIFLPELDKSFDVFIPVNEVTWKIKKMLVKCINDLVNSNFDLKKEYLLVKKDDGKIYKNNDIVIGTDIRNTSELLLLTK